MNQLTPAQLRAVKWYIGDVAGDDPFWGDPKAYVTVNALFFPGIAAESARAKEGKRLNPAILADEMRLMSALRDLLSAFQPSASETEVFRVERYADFLQMRSAGRTVSFTSTSTAGFLEAYQDRVGIALLRFCLPAGTPCIPMAQMLDTYAKAEEAEILLPPGLTLRFTELPLTPDEMRILDANGEPPIISVRVTPQGMSQPESAASSDHAGREAGIRVLSALQAGKAPSSDDVSAYAAWKQAFITALLNCE